MGSRRTVYWFLLATVLAAAVVSAQHHSTADSADELKQVLQRLDRTAADFHSAEASFEWDQYQKVTDETDKQSGKVYFRRSRGATEMAAEVTSPAPPKKVLFADGKVQLFQPKINQLDVYDTSKNNGAVESFLVLGFGGSSKDILNSYEVSYGGSEKVDGADTDRLELIPKADKVKAMFSHIELWIDSRGISIQQKLLSPEGDYRINRYTNIVLNQRIPDGVFKIKTPSNVQIENH
ncbi:MAG: LolA family protein [Terriglobales bacterium]